MRFRAGRALLIVVIVAAATAAACGGIGFLRQYEYEEEMYLSLDGTATVYVNGSVPALDALRGATFDTSPTARVDRAAVRSFFSSPVAHVTRISTSRRDGRRFVHVRLTVDDVRRLSTARAFAWSNYQFGRDGNLFVYRQTIGAAAGRAVGAVGWTGREIVAFRLHLPSKIEYHNTPDGVHRGNILVWEQSLADRLHSVPLTLDARMETESILYRTLWLFGVTFLAVAATFGLAIWWILRRGAKAGHVAAP
jgi:hypothetical protein